MGQKIYLMTINGKILKTKDYAFSIYLDGNSRYGVKLYNKDTKDEIGFFYTLPEIIASMDLIKE